MSESKADKWSQEAEVSFIRKLGTFAASHGKTRADLLKGYIKAHPLRARWIGITQIAFLSLPNGSSRKSRG